MNIYIFFINKEGLYKIKNKFLIKKIDSALDLPLPKYQTEGSSGMDLYANINEQEVIKKSGILLVPTGIKISIPLGYEIQIRPRSGLAINYGITVLNSPGTIDSDYRGEIKIILINHGSEDYIIKRGDRIAQMVVSKIEKVEFEYSEFLNKTNRNENGFGHTGIK